MRKTIQSILLLLILGLASSQTFNGGYLKHLETGTLTALPIDEDTLSITRPTSNFSAAFSRTDTFDSTDTEIFIATSLRDYKVQSPRLGASNSSIHIEVLNPRLNLGKNFLSLTLNTEPSVVNVKPDRLHVYSVRIYYIVVGSGFQGYYTAPISSSYLFARNGNLDLVSLGAGKKYDFHNPKNPSPFTYTYDPLVHVGCGIVYRGNSWILEFGTGCQYMRMFAFITGFQYTKTSAALLNLRLDLAITYNGQFTNPILYRNNVLSPLNVDDGLTVAITSSGLVGQSINRIQLSLVAFALRQYSAPSYPTQLLFPNNFKLNFITNPAGGMYNFNFGASTTQTALTNAADLPGILGGFYYQVTSKQVSHLFCGDNQMNIVVLNRQNIDFELQDINVDIDTSFSLEGKTDSAGGTFLIGLRRTCIMVTGLVDVCQEKIGRLPLDISVPFSSVSLPETNIGTDYLTSLPNANFLYRPVYDTDYIEQLTDLLLIQQVFSEPGSITYKFNYGPNIDVGKAYEGVCHISSNHFPFNGVDLYTFSLKIEIFGQVIYRQTQDISSAGPYTIHFAFINTVKDNSEVTITYSTNVVPSITPTFINFIEFGLIQHNTVLSDKGKCASACPSRNSLQTIGIDYSSTPPTCVYCDFNALNVIFRPELGRCGCKQNFVEVNGICQSCNIPLCSSCTALKDQCLMCTQFAQFININNSSQGCSCISHYYRSDLQCLSCPAGCTQCTNPTSCKSCLANSNTRDKNSTGCACLPGFYEINTPICPKCAPQCATCSKVSTNCTSCRTNNNFIVQGSTCVCANGYFKVLSASGAATCQPCMAACSKCSLKADNCIQCQAFRVRGSDNRCVCKSGYLQINGECVDTLCSAIPYCQSCSILLSNGKSVCKTCTALRKPSTDNTTCICKSGYFQKAGQCQPCAEGCKECTSKTQCTKCADQAYAIGSGQCECPKGNYLMRAGQIIRCALCDANCRICNITSSNCLQCQNGFIAVNKACVCPERYYPTLDNLQCLQCSSGCSKCKSGTSCQQCEPGYTPYAQGCSLSCPTGTFNAGDKCQQCSEQCNHCTSSLSCSGCLSGFKLFAGSCRASCPAGTYAVGALCVACKEPCETCNVLSYSCLSCITGYILINGTCLSDCPIKTFYDGNSCKSCSQSCQNCYENPENCISCPAGKFLVNGKCLSSCPHTVIDGKCTDNCPPKYYLSGQTCRACQGKCETCSAADKCDSCLNELLVYKGTCISACPNNSLKINDYCLDCDASCVGCSQNPFSCLKCQTGYYQFETRCLKSCPSNFYADSASSSCRQCDAGCSVCSKPGQCLVCEEKNTPIAGICPNSCGINCLSCENKVCSLCSDGYIISQGKCQSYCPTGSSVIQGQCTCNSGFLHLNKCVSACPDGFTAQNKICLACKDPCITCSGSVSLCLTCKEGYKLDLVTKKCVPNVDCPYGYYSSIIGGCRLICPQGYYFFDSTCYQRGCPLGFVVNQESRSCKKQQIPTGCTQPYYLQGLSCVNACGTGFYPKPNSRICEACPTNCYTCSDNSSCQACVTGYILKNNVCIATASCPISYFRFGENCVSQCPLGTAPDDGYCTRLCRADTYFYSSRCYSNCATSYRTDDACVQQCPPNYILDGKICKTPSKTCLSTQFYDSVGNKCSSCRSPCQTCSGSASKCLSCANNYYLSNNTCLLKSNMSCPEKCSTCSEPNKCSACASGYINTGEDCIKNLNILKTVEFQEISKSIRGNTIFIQTRLTIVPNTLPSSIASKFYIYSPSLPGVNPVINQWIVGTDVYVALTHSGSIPKYTANLIPNIPILSELYLNMGYKLVNSFLQVEIITNLPAAPASLQIPVTSNSIGPSKIQEQLGKFSLTLNAVVSKALKL